MIAGVVLAGGQSSRMGSDKSQLKLSGISLIQHSKNLLSEAGLVHIYVSGHLGIKDQKINKGPLAGISASLEFLKKYQYVLFTTVDMPLLNKQIFQQLITCQNAKTVYIDHYFFPMLICNTVINREIISIQLDNESLSVRNMLEKLEAISLNNQWAQELFLNVNTKDDWQKALEYKKLTSSD